MEETKILKELPGLILPWYEAGHRDLPWRKDREPYHIWISEIMLQQTRVEAVKGYYSRFLTVLPTVQALAACDDDTLHKLWEGLGYYSRVRNLKKAAGVIVTEYGGHFPETHSQVLSLPGIGPYTAGAICSIAYDLPTPAVDGNVLRLLSRLRDDDRPIDLTEVKKDVTALLAEVYPPEAGTFTQALMELGATLCGPNRAPDCQACPLNRICRACHAGTAESLPRKSPKKERRQENRTVFILTCDGSYALLRRPPKGLLASLWEFPNLEGALNPQQAMEQAEKWELKPRELLKQADRTHIFTHIQWNLTGYYIEVSRRSPSFQWFTDAEIRAQAALPTAFRQFFPENTEMT